MAAAKRASFERENIKLFREIDCGSSPDQITDKIPMSIARKWRRKGLCLNVKTSNYFVKLIVEVLHSPDQMSRRNSRVNYKKLVAKRAPF